MTAQLLVRARAGDGDAFRELTEPHRRELHVHCYRMLGSFQDAEDALQDTLLAAWHGLAAFKEHASLRTWLYRVATNRCLDLLRAARRRPTTEIAMPDVTPPQPTRLGEVAWLEPYPDALLDRGTRALGPDARYEQTEAMSLAFLTALQTLPPRQRAVLILRDVLGYRAVETADLLDATVESVNSSLKRARATLERRTSSAAGREPPPSPGSATEEQLVRQLVHAYESGDVDTLVALLTEDVWVSMPPMPLEYQGRDLAAEFHRTVSFRDGRTYDVVPTRANGQLAFGTYLRAPVDGVRHAMGLLVFTLTGDRVCGITRFDNSVLPWFGLPRSLAG
jgi:RNA polymerase sigma-70 factor (ECF subfamily)